jgi:hypothetical protein
MENGSPDLLPQAQTVSITEDGYPSMIGRKEPMYSVVADSSAVRLLCQFLVRGCGDQPLGGSREKISDKVGF